LSAQGATAFNVRQHVRLADLGKRTLSAARIANGRRHCVSAQQRAHGGGSLLHEREERLRKDNLTTAMAAGVVNSAARHSMAGHLFKAQRLRRQLQIVVRTLAARTVLVLHRIGRAVSGEFDDIGLANEPKPFASQW
jgi:hypothetical protein